jgi:hypothetical protein
VGEVKKRAHRNRSVLGALGASLVPASIAVSPAAAHDQRRDSVDCGLTFVACQVRWEDQTRYDDARRFAIGQWNRLGKVDIVPDSAVTVADLEFIDFNECGVTWDAFWSSRIGVDVIAFNPCSIRRTRLYPPDPRAVAVHELGHARALPIPRGPASADIG